MHAALEHRRVSWNYTSVHVPFITLINCHCMSMPHSRIAGRKSICELRTYTQQDQSLKRHLVVSAQQDCQPECSKARQHNAIAGNSPGTSGLLIIMKSFSQTHLGYLSSLQRSRVGPAEFEMSSYYAVLKHPVMKTKLMLASQNLKKDL